GNDTILGQDGVDHIYGDDGFNLDLSKRLSLSTQILSVVTAPSGSDNVARPGHFQTSDSLQAGNDVLHGEGGDDLIFGDHGVIDQVAGINRILTTGDVVGLRSVRLNDSGSDVLTGGAGQDVLIGGGRGDAIDGGTGDDLIFGDAVALRLADGAAITTRRFQHLQGSLLYARTDVAGSPAGVASGTLLVDGIALDYRNRDGSVPYWAYFIVDDLWHSAAIEAGIDPVAGPASFGNDHIAGNAGNDLIFGQLGDDVIQGDGSIDGWLFGTPTGAGRTGQSVDNPIGDLWVVPSFEADSDGDDYIEGGGGDDVIFGGLGQDDLVGGSSDFFGLDSASLRPDGADLIFGGAGTQTGRNSYADGAIGSPLARDADVIVGDNGNIVRIVNADGSAPVFNYDLSGDASAGYGPERIAVRGVELLDYTAGGPDFRPDLFGTGRVTGCGYDIGGADEVHGESGNDTVYGGCGNDSLYGDSGDDDLIGNWGSDWISGGTGQDGILGDDGRIHTSRNGDPDGEPLHGVAPIAPQDLDARISAQLGAQVTVINVSGALKKAADLTPFGLDPNAQQNAPDDVLFDPLYADDIIFGGLGSDFLHGGAGDDAMSGAEALEESYAPRYDTAGTPIGTVRIDFLHPYNPSDALHFGPDHDAWDPGLVLTSSSNGSALVGGGLLTDQSGMLDRMGEFALYDEYDPRRRIQLAADGTATKDGTGGQFFLNFKAIDDGAPTVTDPRTSTPNWGTVQTDGDDVLFGDLGNDWLVGGTGRDSLYGGFGNDLLNADDDLDTNGGLNDRPDTHPSYEDMAFGGAGLDVLIANTGGDRLIDWQGDFNSFIVPFSWYSMPTISRWFVPELDDLTYRLLGYQIDSLSSDGCWHRAPIQLQTGPCRNLTLEEYLYQRSASEGADPTRAADTGTDTVSQGNRNGEPRGELGLVTPRDRDYWRDQEGIPSDPPGLIPSQRRDVAYSAADEDGTVLPFTTLENGFFGGANVMDLLFGYDGTSVNLGILQTSVGGPGHNLVLALPLATLKLDVTSINVQLGTVATSIVLGAPRGTTLAGLVTFSAFVASIADLIFDAEDNVSAALAQSVSGTTGYTLGDLLTDSSGALLRAVTTTTDSMNPSPGTTGLTDSLAGTTESTVGGIGTTLDGATAPALGTVATTTAPLVGTLDETAGGVLSQLQAGLDPVLSELEQLLAVLGGAESWLEDFLTDFEAALDAELRYRLDGTYKWLRQVRGHVQDVQDWLAELQGDVQRDLDAEIAYRLNGTYKWLGQLKGDIQEIQDWLGEVQGAVDDEIAYRMNGTYKWLQQVGGHVRDVQDAIADVVADGQTGVMDALADTQGALNDELAYRIAGTQRWFQQLRGEVQAVTGTLQTVTVTSSTSVVEPVTTITSTVQEPVITATTTTVTATQPVVTATTTTTQPVVTATTTTVSTTTTVIKKLF
ncbi:hypothetical protein, partial [Paraconexibacter sp.]|uniref:hypothetical protein n=1 Tax=Paraconexibacter sp. TaxID=2949640 RepID=UPI003566AC40